MSPWMDLGPNGVPLRGHAVGVAHEGAWLRATCECNHAFERRLNDTAVFMDIGQHLATAARG